MSTTSDQYSESQRHPTTLEFYDSLKGLTREEATQRLPECKTRELKYVVDQNTESLKMANMPDRLRCAFQKGKIVKVYGNS